MKTTKSLAIASLFVAVLAAACNPAAPDDGTAAQDGNMPAMPNMPAAGQSATEHKAVGTVNAIDAAAGTVNISHGPVASANWPAMTMTFKLSNPSVAANVTPGARVEFHFTIESGMSATVTAMTPGQ